jgi:alpha 1,2-mannosyltransferase
MLTPPPYPALPPPGCRLPIEVWFPQQEAPSPGLRSALEELGVSCRQLPSSLATGYSYKAVALLLSSFREVLLVDADNIALTDPAELFASDEYKWVA